MTIKKLYFIVFPSPIIIEMTGFLFINIIIVIRFLNICSLFLSHYFPSSIIEHPFLCYSVDSLVIFIGLLLLGYSVSTFILSHVIFKEILTMYLTIRTHFWRTHKSLTHERALSAIAVHIFVDWVSGKKYCRKIWTYLQKDHLPCQKAACLSWSYH